MRAGEARHDGSDWNVQGFCDIYVAEVPPVTQEENLSVNRRKALETCFHPESSLLLEKEILQALSFVWNEFVVPLVYEFRVTMMIAEEVDGSVARDSVEPSPDAEVGIEEVPLSHGADERLTDDLFRVLQALHDPIRVEHELLAVADHQKFVSLVWVILRQSLDLSITLRAVLNTFFHGWLRGWLAHPSEGRDEHSEGSPVCQ